jgi:hypothetical protein
MSSQPSLERQIVLHAKGIMMFLFPSITRLCIIIDMWCLLEQIHYCLQTFAVHLFKDEFIYLLQ